MSKQVYQIINKNCSYFIRILSNLIRLVFKFPNFLINFKNHVLKKFITADFKIDFPRQWFLSLQSFSKYKLKNRFQIF